MVTYKINGKHKIVNECRMCGWNETIKGINKLYNLNRICPVCNSKLFNINIIILTKKEFDELNY